MRHLSNNFARRGPLNFANAMLVKASLLLVIAAAAATPGAAQQDEARRTQVAKTTKATIKTTTKTSGTAAAKMRRETPNFGRIEITTSPGEFPLLIDGQVAGAVGAAVRFVDLSPGRHTVEIQFPNGRRWTRAFDVVAGRRQCVTLNYSPRQPCVATISAPSSVGEGDVITFAADVKYDGKQPLDYAWTVTPSSARILSGQGTPTITVDSTNLGREKVTAVLNLDDRASDSLCACRQEVSGATLVNAGATPNFEPRRFDDFPSLSFDDDKARLDYFAIELQNNPGAVGYVAVFAARGARPNSANRVGVRARDYLTNTRGLDASRVVLVNGAGAAAGERHRFELWLVPRGAQPPKFGAR